MTVLLTGATGFIGSHVARVLVHAGHDVVATLRDGSDLWRIEDVVSAIELVRCDVRSSDDVQRCVDRIRPEVCVHLAWCVEPGQYLWSLENFDMLTASVGLASRLRGTAAAGLSASAPAWSTTRGWATWRSRAGWILGRRTPRQSSPPRSPSVS
ncbi:MAG: SDR family NAD(P)-dependent oxidoreductase [Chloroflexi bacterium]|nr:SDR family NAD(P)-dependent oxidoreductase [Chloroflexota bacterium]